MDHLIMKCCNCQREWTTTYNAIRWTARQGCPFCGFVGYHSTRTEKAKAVECPACHQPMRETPWTAADYTGGKGTAAAVDIVEAECTCGEMFRLYYSGVYNPEEASHEKN